MPALTGIDHIAITVSDLAVSVPFYERLLGAGPIATLDDGPFIRALFDLPAGMHLGLTQHDAGSGLPFEPTTPGLDHIGFAVADRAELEAWLAHVAAMGAENSGIVEADYGTVLSVKDPDGVALEFFVAA